jgi:hypothetical protein
MTGYTVHTGTSKKFTHGWDRVFSGPSEPTEEQPTRSEKKKPDRKKKKSGKGRKKNS